MIRLYAFIAVFIWSSLAAHAQGLPGYVLTLTGDTLRGIVAERSQEQVYFYTSPDQQPQIFGPDHLNAYGLNGQVAIRSQVVQSDAGGASKHFVLPLQLGQASLYTFQDQTGLLLLPPASDTLYLLTASNWHVLLNRYLRNCSSLDHTSYAMLSKSFSEANIRSVVRQYNGCVDPAWKSSGLIKASVWRSGFGLQITPMSVRYKEKNTRLATGPAYQAGLEWVAVRASGLQTTVSGGYLYFRQSTGLHTDDFLQRPVLEKKYLARFHMLSATLSVGQRFGKPNGVSLLVGSGIGVNYNLKSESEMQQRPLGTQEALTTETSYYDRGGLVVHLDATAGVIMPFRQHHELRLAAIYQRYVFLGTGMLGIQGAYTLFRK